MKLTSPLIAVLLVCSAAPALAQGMPGEGRWGGRPGDGGWQGEDGDPRYPSARQSAQPSKKIDVTAYRSVGAEALLGKGRIVVSRAAGDAGDNEDGGIDNSQMAARLATALLKRFPDGQVVQPLAAVTP